MDHEEPAKSAPGRKEGAASRWRRSSLAPPRTSYTSALLTPTPAIEAHLGKKRRGRGPGRVVGRRRGVVGGGRS